ncbi:MAG: putative toxin-antitoxin system toxin component, PIN family [Elusimicrobiota bacterium]
MKIVLDTNVLVSGFLNPYGPPGLLVQYAADGSLKLCYDARILAEYREVLLRPRFRFDTSAIEDFLEQIKADGYLVIPKPLAGRLPDAADEAFLETALTAAAAYLVTGNKKHYPPALTQGAKIVSPAEFLDIFRVKSR